MHSLPLAVACTVPVLYAVWIRPQMDSIYVRRPAVRPVW